jgi:hypothetical protein
MSAQILEPVRCVVLGDDVETAVVFGEPDLDFARLAGLASAGRQIKIWFDGDFIDP